MIFLNTLPMKQSVLYFIDYYQELIKKITNSELLEFMIIILGISLLGGIGIFLQYLKHKRRYR